MHMENALENAARVFVYGALFPVKYDAWAPPASANRSTQWQGYQPVGGLHVDTGRFAATTWYCPLHDVASTGQVSYPIDPSDASDSWQVIAYAHRTGGGTYDVFTPDPFKFEFPDAKGVTDKLFNPPDQGGLGLDQEKFYWRYFGSDNTQQLKSYPYSSVGSGDSAYSPVDVKWMSKADTQHGADTVDASCGW